MGWAGPFHSYCNDRSRMPLKSNQGEGAWREIARCQRLLLLPLIRPVRCVLHPTHHRTSEIDTPTTALPIINVVDERG